MNKHLIGALGLSLVISSVGLQAQEVPKYEIANMSYAVASDDEAQFEIIQNESTAIQESASEVNTNGTMTNENTTNEVNNGELINNSELSNNEGTTDTSGEATNTSGDNSSTVGKSDQIILTIDSKVAVVNGVEQELICPPTVINNTTLLPMRFVAEQVIGAQMLWDPVTQTATMTKGDTTVKVTIGNKIATIDGLEVELQAAPIVKDNTTLVPLRFLSEAFNVSINYDPSTKTITLDKAGQHGAQTGQLTPLPNQAPNASFYFPESYVAGQQISVVNDSSDPDGDMIVDQLWCVMGEKTVTNKELTNMFKTPRAGTYTIGLKVQDAKGAWSEWNYQTVTILPNEAPVITDLSPMKSSYAKGEVISFLPYSYENEEWETVKEGKWTYRQVGEAESRATLGRPTAIFTEGDYIVTLYLDDAYGNRSQGYETTVHISGETLDTELNYKFSVGLIGDWIDNFDNFNYLSFKEASVIEKTYDYGTLIMSDSPEEVKGQGILYQDCIDGKGRLLIHHINTSTSTEKQRLAFIVENPTTEPITVKLINKAIKGPATDILRVGQLSLSEYLSGTIPTETISLEPGERKYFYDKNWNVNTCISAHIDVETTGKAKFIVANLNESDTLESLDSLYYYPADGVHYSGTYDKIGIHYNLNLSGTESERLTLGVVNSGEWVVGYDERTNNPVENAGNFGVSYYITVTAQEDMGVILNNRGGMFQGAVKWNDTVHTMPGKGTFIGTTTKAVVLGTIKKGETVTIEYILPNGSAAPTLLGFIPKSQW